MTSNDALQVKLKIVNSKLSNFRSSKAGWQWIKGLHVAPCKNTNKNIHENASSV